MTPSFGFFKVSLTPRYDTKTPRKCSNQKDDWTPKHKFYHFFHNDNRRSLLGQKFLKKQVYFSLEIPPLMHCCQLHQLRWKESKEAKTPELMLQILYQRSQLGKNSLVCCSTGNVFQRTMLCPWRVYFKPEESIPTFITNACFFLLHFQKNKDAFQSKRKH